MFSIFSKKKEPMQLWFDTDVHCHVVPGIDDGSPDAATSATLIEHMQRWGIERILATPHVTNTTFENTPAVMDAALAELQAELDRRGNKISVTHSAEYRLDELFQKEFEADNLVPYPSGHVLVENSFILEPWNLDQQLFNIQVKGHPTILAHPERYRYYHQKRERYHALHNAGTLFQVNLLSMAGYYGKDEKRMAEYLIDNDLVDFVGTDLHGMRHVECIDAYLCSKDAHRHAERLRGRIMNSILAG